MMSSNTRRTLLVSIAVTAVFLAACSTGPRDSSTFSRSNAGQVQSVEMGTIQALRSVTIENESRGRATAVGATAGAVAAGTVGAAAGGVAGRAISGGDTAAVEFTVRLESGKSIVVVQPGSVNDFRVGDRVRVTSDGSQTRVAR